MSSPCLYWMKLDIGIMRYRIGQKIQQEIKITGAGTTSSIGRTNEYYGFGVGAHGYVNNMRIVNYENIPTFISHVNQSENAKMLYRETIKVDHRERMQDEMMLGLRLIDEGVSATAFKLKFGNELTDIFEKEISHLIGQKLIQWKDGLERRLFLQKGEFCLATRFLWNSLGIRIHEPVYLILLMQPYWQGEQECTIEKAI